MTSTIDQLRYEPQRRNELLEKATVLGGGILGGVAARKLLGAVWKRSSASGAPPLTPGDPGVSWKQATMWALSSGIGAGISRMLARRLAARATRSVRTA